MPHFINTLHLRVIQPVLAEDREPSQIPALCNLQRTEIAWNDTFTAFRLVPLKWWDDASYIAYQARDIDDRDDYYPSDVAPTAPRVAPPPASFPVSSDPDDILF